MSHGPRPIVVTMMPLLYLLLLPRRTIAIFLLLIRRGMFHHPLSILPPSPATRNLVLPTALWMFHVVQRLPPGIATGAAFRFGRRRGARGFGGMFGERRVVSLRRGVEQRFRVVESRRAPSSSQDSGSSSRAYATAVGMMAIGMFRGIKDVDAPVEIAGVAGIVEEGFAGHGIVVVGFHFLCRSSRRRANGVGTAAGIMVMVMMMMRPAMIVKGNRLA
mmetsp:Transcript_25566/g.52856  ORF Transcript_25566/g.52856 Transcript_25566/m.52856 type:complete len:218 (-) Transcript_25566:1076-1729(-)